MSVLRLSIALSTACMAVSGPVRGQADTTGAHLGEVRFETSCPAPARDPLNHATALLHHMTYTRARAAYTRVADEHPTCALAHWGVAMTLFQPLWPTRPSAADLERGWRAVQRAREIGVGTERERMFIDAAAAFFEPGSTEYWQRIERWAAATRALYERFPDDVETRAFFALSQLATAPPSADAARRARVADLLAGVLRDAPAHPGAIHYTIHANDAAGREREALDVVRSYARIAPRNPHALHMPTHIHVRLGEWVEAIALNERAAEAALEDRAGDRQQWTWDEYPHALEYLVYASLQVGDDSTAARALERLLQVPDLQPTFKTAFHVASIPARFALERGDWQRAARLEPRVYAGLDWDRFPWPEAVSWFARGIGSARLGDAERAGAAEARLAVLRDASVDLGEALFAQQTEILRLGVAGWLAHLEGDDARAVRLLEEAVALEQATPKPPVTPAPILPAQELLGDLLLELGRDEEALAAYRTSLEAAPNRFNGLLGAARAARRMGDDELAATYYRGLRSLAASSPRREVAEAVAFLRR